MDGWKVITNNRCSASISPLHTHVILYPVNEIVVPKIPHSKLFFFKKREDAEDFITVDDGRLNIVPCIAYNCTKNKYMSEWFDNDESNIIFWGRINKKKRSYGVPTPPGTWMAEKIKCLE
jgi:hypothetical protein